MTTTMTTSNDAVKTISEIPHFKRIDNINQTSTWLLQNIDGELVQIWVGRLGSGFYHKTAIVTFDELQRFNFDRYDFPWE